MQTIVIPKKIYLWADKLAVTKSKLKRPSNNSSSNLICTNKQDLALNDHQEG